MEMRCQAKNMNCLSCMQGVHEVNELTQRPMQAGEEPVSRMVFIGKDLLEDEIRKRFLMCLAE